MIQKIEKTFGRTILVDVVDMAKNMSPIGFETMNPSMSFVRMPHGKYGVRIKATEPVDCVIRQDNKVIFERQLEAGVVHTLTRQSDGKPFYFAAPGEKPAFVSDKAGLPVGANEEEAKQLLLYPEADLGDDRYAESHGLIIVQVRFAHVQPDYGPLLPPDDFANVLFQFNTPADHNRAVVANFARMEAPDALPEGESDIVSPDGQRANPIPQRTCCIAHDRNHRH